jgi:hypothetical protein
MRALFETVRWKEKEVLIYYRSASNDVTADNWRTVARDAQVQVASDAGIDVSSIGSIKAFWNSLS